MAKTFERSSLSRLVRALAFAANKHSRQRRKDVEASPYINHPIAVVSILAVEAGVEDCDVLCAALLHDTVEDTQTSVQELRENFGEATASVVMELTDDKSLKFEERKRLQVVHAPDLSPAARLVKVADKIANLRDMAPSPPPDWSLARRRDYFDWARDVVDAIPDVHPRLNALFDDIQTRRP